MDLFSFVAEISSDANPQAQGFQAHPGYVLINVFVPLIVGGLVAVTLRAIERFLEFGVHGGEG